jgi:hypothetical protein
MAKTAWFCTLRRRNGITEQEAVDIWTADKATIRAEIGQRKAVRQLALLPLLDEQHELEHACRLIRDKRWYAFKKCKHADYERFRDGVYVERGIPSGIIGGWARHIEISKGFEAYLRANYADEIAAMMDIAPDYLAITRQTVEGASHGQPADLRHAPPLRLLAGQDGKPNRVG